MQHRLHKTTKRSHIKVVKLAAPMDKTYHEKK